MATPPNSTAPARPAPPPHAPHQESHQNEGAEWLEEAVFGSLDGVITSLGLVVTVGAVLSLENHAIFLTVIAAAVAGTLSMFVGAFLSARSTENLIRRERAREEWEVDHVPQIERQEVEEIYRKQGYTEAETATLVEILTRDKKRWVDMMMRDELGLPYEPPKRSFRHAAIIGLSYLVGAGIPALPFLYPNDPTRSVLGHAVGVSFLVSLGLGALILATVGVLDAGFAGRSRVRSAAEIIAIGFATAIAVFLVTTLLAPA
ncbi:MAG TPA: VIT1/CCC1 transporter family protein [Thermoplasmata archaeon]|nr:VIT1/CCC1 transporter family protein [Thermoplasmata archaeon]HUI38148.1 VIT1/CCC1 transporter family protein [Thermoplasmata archaeon]